MRSALLASVALTATLTTAFAPSIADACGGYMPDPGPRVFALETHNHAAVNGTERWQRRSFVLLAPTQKPDADWRPLAPGTFDPTQIALEIDTATPTTMTLVGPSGTSVVSSKHRAHVTKGWTGDTVFAALEVTTGDESRFQIALPGSQPDAKWMALSNGKPRPSTLAWVKAQGYDPTYVYVLRVKGTYLEIVSAHQPGASELVSFVRLGGHAVAQSAGNAIGAVELGGKRYVLFETNGLITPVKV